MKTTAKCEVDVLLERYSMLEPLKDDLLRAIEMIITAYKNGGKLLVCGNGGSAADSLHIVGELMKGFVLPRKVSGSLIKRLQQFCPENVQYYMNNLQGALPAISLVNEVGLTTAYANDIAPDLVFAQQLFGQGRAGDVLFAISTSGNSTNVIHAINIANAMQISVIGLTGMQKGKMGAGICNVLLSVPSKETYQIQELHLPIYHAICLALEKEFFGEGN